MSLSNTGRSDVVARAFGFLMRLRRWSQRLPIRVLCLAAAIMALVGTLIAAGAQRLVATAGCCLLVALSSYAFGRSSGSVAARTRAALMASEARYRAISELTSDYVYALTVEAGNQIRNQWITDAFQRITGYTPRELEERGGWKLLIHPDDLPIAAARSARLFAGETDVSRFRIVTRDGAVRWVLDYARPIRDPHTGAIAELLGAVRDITEHYEAQLELQRVATDNLRFAQALGATSDGIAIADARLPGQPLVYVNPAFTRITGYEAEEVLGRNCRFLQGPGTDPATVTALREAIIARRAVHVELLNYRKDGQPFWNELRIAPIQSDDGEVIAFVGVQTDITARRHTEDALREREALMRQLTNQLPAVIWTVDRDLRIVTASGADIVRHGYDKFNVIGLSLSEIFGTDDPSYPPIAAHLAALKGESATYERAIGDRLYDVRVEPQRDARGRIIGCLSLALDVTERIQAEEQTRRSMARARLRANLGQALAEARLDTQAILDRVVQQIAEALGDSCAIRLLDTERRCFVHGALHHRLPARAGELRSVVTGLVLDARQGLSGQVLETGHSVLVNVQPQPGVQADEAPDWLVQLGFSSVVVVPLRIQGVIGGTLAVARDVGSPPLTPEDQSFIHDLADRAALAIANAQLYAASQRRLAYLQGLQVVDRTVTASLSLDVTFAVVLDQVTSCLGVDAASVLLLDPLSGQLEYAAGRGFWTEAIQRSRIPLEAGLAGRAALGGRVHVVSDLSSEPNIVRAGLLRDEHVAWYAAAPLTVKGQVLGVLEIFHRTPTPRDAEWLDALHALATHTAIAIDNAQLFRSMQRARAELATAYDATIEGWSRALDLRDRETEGHSQRVTDMSLRIARALDLPPEELVHIRRGALLHDIGKMGIPDAILLKPGPLTEEEWAIMRMHPVYAYELLSPIVYLRPALDIPYAHHEKWDGTGYPRKLRAEQIPLSARIFAVADVWDALRSDRPYRAGWPEERVREHIASLAGAHFDPQVVDVFLRLDAQQTEQLDRAEPAA